jgi:methylation protein EvaC|tara:strand:- start:4607 stop:5743 length:1137 start_codon:yes stop_codon:yes gene_type:complete
VKKEFLNLGKQPLANSFISSKDIESEFFYNLKVVWDSKTCLVSLKDFVKPNLMFNDKYKYHTSLSTPMVKHYKDISKRLKKEFNPQNILEIGSNDGTLIRNFEVDKSVCVEPCDNFAKITGEMGYNTYTDFWDTELSEKIKNFRGKMDLIYSSNTICHIQDLNNCFSAIDNILDDYGVFVFEDPSLLQILNRGSYDQFYDEHSHTFSIISLQNILSKFDLKIFRVEELETHGGSNRVYVSKKRRKEKSVRDIISKELEFGLDDFSTYEMFGKQVEQSKIELLKQLKGKRVVSIGATCKSSIVFNYCGIDSSMIECITDTTPDKQGLLSPGTHIPIVDRESINLNDYDCVFLGAWNFMDYIIDKEKEFKGKFITHIKNV